MFRILNNASSIKFTNGLMDTCLTHSISYHIPVLNIITKHRLPALKVAGYDFTVCYINRLKGGKKGKRDSQLEKLHCLFLLRCQGSVPAARAVVTEAPASSSLVMRGPRWNSVSYSQQVLQGLQRQQVRAWVKCRGKFKTMHVELSVAISLLWYLFLMTAHFW